MSKHAQPHTKADRGGQRPAKTSGKSSDAGSPAAKSSQRQQGQSGQQGGKKSGG